MIGQPLTSGHPRSLVAETPNPEELARDLREISRQIDGKNPDSTEVGALKDRLAMLSARCQWVQGHQERKFLEELTAELWNQFETKA